MKAIVSWRRNRRARQPSGLQNAPVSRSSIMSGSTNSGPPAPESWGLPNDCSDAHACAGLGPLWDHTGMRDGERSARSVNVLPRQKLAPDAADQRKRVTAIHWGSSGCRFKSCQPDTGQRLFSDMITRRRGVRTQTLYPNQLPTRARQQTCTDHSPNASTTAPVELLDIHITVMIAPRSAVRALTLLQKYVSCRWAGGQNQSLVRSAPRPQLLASALRSPPGEST